MTKLPVARRLAATGLLVLLATGCGRKPKEVRLTPLRTTVYGLKRTVVMNAEVLDTKGKAIPGPILAWETDHPKVATIDKNGVLTTVAPGRTGVKVTFQDMTASSTVEVVDAATMTISPLRMTLAGPPGTNGRFRAEVKSSKGAIVEARVKWSCSEPKVATVNAEGVVTAVGAGRATISATLGDVASSSDLTVSPHAVAQFDARPRTLILRPKDVQQITPTALDAAGREIPDPAVEWVSSDPKTAQVLGGVVTGIAPGTATIRATAGPYSVDVSVLVN